MTDEYQNEPKRAAEPAHGDIFESDGTSASADARGLSRNTVFLLALMVVAFFMLGFAFLNVPLFGLLCEKLGFAQNPNNQELAEIENMETSDREVDVIFMGNVVGTLPVKFRSDKRVMTVRLGERTINDYHFTNMANRKVFFRPVHSVRPTNAAVNFALSECFCFDDQFLYPEQQISLPVVFKISPELDPEVRQVTLNYTLFEIDEKDYQPPSKGAKAEESEVAEVKP